MRTCYWTRTFILWIQYIWPRINNWDPELVYLVRLNWDLKNVNLLGTFEFLPGPITWLLWIRSPKSCVERTIYWYIRRGSQCRAQEDRSYWSATNSVHMAASDWCTRSQWRARASTIECPTPKRSVSTFSMWGEQVVPLDVPQPGSPGHRNTVRASAYQTSPIGSTRSNVQTWRHLDPHEHFSHLYRSYYLRTRQMF